MTNSTIRDELEVNLEDEFEETNSRIFDSTSNNCLLG